MMYKKPASILLGLVLIPFAGDSADVRQGLVSYAQLAGLSADFSTTPDLAGGNLL
jgi:hypothetical protein